MTAPSRGAGALIGVSLVLVAGLAAWYGREVRADSGWFVAVLFGLPLACAIGALWAERVSRRSVVAPVVVGLLGLVSLVWSIVTAGGVGLVLLVPALVLVVAALVSWADRRPDRRTDPART